MRTHYRRLGGSLSLLGWRFGLLVAVVALSGSPSSAYILNATITVVPSKPSSYEPITIRLDRLSSDSCVPTEASFFEDDYSIFLNQSAGPCAEVATPWTLDVVFLGLPSGSYFFDFYESGVGFVGRIAFEVAERTGTVLHGFVSRRTVCKNLTTGKKVFVLAETSIVNCEAAGLNVRPGDKVLVRSRGIASQQP